MLIVSYDISNDKTRAHFAKFLSRFGHRIQYSVFEIENSEKMLRKITAEIDNKFEHRFEQADSVIIFILSNSTKTIRYGYAKNVNEDVVLIN